MQDFTNGFMDRLQDLSGLEVLGCLNQVGRKIEIGGSSQDPWELVVITELLDMTWVITRFFLKLSAGTMNGFFTRLKMSCWQVIDYLAHGMAILAGEDNASRVGEAHRGNCFHRTGEIEVRVFRACILQRV